MILRKRDPGPAGETFESFLEERGTRDDVYEHALKAVLAWQRDREMKRQKAARTPRRKH